MKIYLLLLLLVSASVFAEKSAELAPGKITTVRLHGSIHSSSAARDQALLIISGLEEGCTSGVFLNAKTDRELYAIVLAAYTSKSAARIGYEPNIRAPWGDSKYCALTYFDIK